MTLRVGLFGTGHWAQRTHGPALAAHPGVELVGVWGRDPAKATTVGVELAVPGFVRADDLIDAVDAVSIAVPPDVQAPLAIRAAVAGRHLLLDKPVALSTSAADDVVAAVAVAGVASVVFFAHRFYSNVDEFVAGAAGSTWDAARVTMFASIFRPGNPYGASPWRREHGALWDIGPHALSVVLPLLGPVADVVAFSGPHDSTHALLRHATGAVTSLAVSLDAPPDGTLGETVLYGQDGAVVVPRGQGTQVEAFTVAVDQLIAAVAGDGGPPCDVRFGRDVVAVLEAVQQVRR